MIRNLIVAAAAVVMSFAAQAGEEELYIGAGVGNFEQGAFDATFLELTAGVQITEVASVEVSYQQFEEVKAGGSEIKTSAANVSVLAEKSIDERLGLMGRVFISFIDQNAAGSGNGSDMGFGAGITYKVGEEKTSNLRLEYRTIDPGAADDATSIHLGIIKYFD